MYDVREALTHLELKDDQGRFVTADPRIVDLALRILELFQEGCRKAVGSTQLITRKNVAYIYKAAKLCDEYGETPELFVAKQLRGMLQFSKLWINGLASPLIHRTVEEAADVKLEAVRYYKSQLALFESRRRLYGPSLALEDEANDFSPLFRYVIANELGLQHVADAYREDAKLELAKNPVARDVFGNRLETLGVAADPSALPPIAGADITVS